MNYIRKNHLPVGGQLLGSFQSITDEDGTLVEKYAFDPCSVTSGFGEFANPNPLVEQFPLEARKREGRRRNPDDWSFTDVQEDCLFDRGYTGHEHLDEFGLVNMNGRVYDPFVARFLSPDPFVQNISSTQSFNRYSYGFNNPLKFIDPSGYTNHPISAEANVYVNNMAWDGYQKLNSGPMGPGSGNHWSDQYRNEFGNFMLMNSSTFDDTYGEGSFDLVVEHLPSIESWSFRGFWAYIPNNNEYSIHQREAEYENPNMIFKKKPLPGPEIILKFFMFEEIRDNWNDQSQGDGFPQAGDAWQEGMPTAYHTNDNMLVVSKKTNTYMNINDRKLLGEYVGNRTAISREKGNIYIPRADPLINQLSGTTHSILFGAAHWLGNPVPGLPDGDLYRNVANRIDCRNMYQKYDLYLKYNAIYE